MGRQLSGFLAALWLLSGLAEAALAARPRTQGSTRPAAAKKRQTAKVRKRSPRPKTRVTRAALLKAPHKPRKKLSIRKPVRKRVARSARAPRAPRRYIRSFRALVTAYVPINTPMEGGRWTCTMRDGWKTHGIAVDPKYIPLGSLLYVPGYGKALADDTGGRIKGRHIDVRQHSVDSMHRWGVKRLRVYVLKHPKKKKRVPRTISA